MSEVLPTLGQRLRAERERRGMSAQKAADEMHLDAWVIDALEAGDYQRIGPSVYAKGHLKKYASILGLSPADIAAANDIPSTPPVAAASQPGGLRMRSTAPDATNLPWPQMAAFAAIAVVIGGIFWWQPWRQRFATAPAAVASNGSPASAPSTASDQTTEGSVGPQRSDSAAEPVAIARDAAGSAAMPPTPASAAATPAVMSGAAGSTGEPDSTLGAGAAHLRLSFSADSWVDVHDSTGRRVYSGNGRANSVKTIAGTAPLKVFLGFASGVQLEVNDRAVVIGPQFVTGDVARFEAGADGVLRHESHPLPTNGVQTRTAQPHG
jgi:cytoskeleton protein RodZ